VTLPTPDAQSPRFLSQQTPSTHSIHSIPTNHSIPATLVPSSLHATSLNPPASETEASAKIARERATNFATHSWDLATGGLKTLTAKRELPPRLERRTSKQLSDTPATPRSYVFPLVILACIVIMLTSGGIVLYMMLQP
jgi:hypothetical protein